MATNLDPRFASDATSARIVRLLYGQLVDFNELSEPVPSLATWAVISPTHYRFTLREPRPVYRTGESVRVPMTSADVASTYRSVLDPAVGSPHRGSLVAIAEVKAVDERTVDFVLTKPDPLFPGKLTIGIMPAAELGEDHDFATRPIGSGPFVFHSKPGPQRLKLLRVRDGLAVEFIRVSDPLTRALKLARFEADIAQGNLSPELTGWLGQQPGIDVQTVAGTRFAYLGFNLSDPVTGSPAVRAAIAYGIDRNAIINYVMGGRARLGNSVIPPDHWAGYAGLASLMHDPERARTILAGIGYGPSNPLQVVYKTSADPFRIRLATIIQHQLSEVGIEVTVQSLDWGTFYGDVKAGRFQMYSLAWVGVKQPDIFRYIFHSASVPPGGANRGRLVDAKVDELIDTADSARSRDQQALKYRELQQRIHALLPYVPLWYEDNVVATNERIAGYTTNRDGDYDALTIVEVR